MKFNLLLPIFTCIFFISCSKTEVVNQPKSKTDYYPILSAISPKTALAGDSIISKVRCGFYEYFADISFLGFEIEEPASNQFNIKAKASYKNINYNISLPVVMIADQRLALPTPSTGRYILKFYSLDNLVQTDTVQVN